MSALIGHITYNRFAEALALLRWTTEEERASVKELIQRKTNFSQTCLHWCACRDSIEVFRAIVDFYGEDRASMKEVIQQKDNNGWTCLYMCACKDSIEVFRAIVDFYGEDRASVRELIQQKTNVGWTCLHCCASFNSIKVFRAIVAFYGEEHRPQLAKIIKSSLRLKQFVQKHNIPDLLLPPPTISAPTEPCLLCYEVIASGNVVFCPRLIGPEARPCSCVLHAACYEPLPNKSRCLSCQQTIEFAEGVIVDH